MTRKEVSLEDEILSLRPGGWSENLELRLANRSKSRIRASLWRWDRDWDPQGAVFESWPPGLLWSLFVLTSASLLLTLLLVGLIVEHRDFGFILVVAILDIFPTIALFESFRQLLQARKFGDSRLSFVDFPFRLGTTLKAILRTEKPTSATMRVDATLRCIEDRVYTYMETVRTKSGSRTVERKEERERLEHVQLFAAAVSAPYDPAERGWRLSFDIPADARPSHIDRFPLTYWELEVSSELTGVDYEAVFVVPVVDADAASAAAALPRDPSASAAARVALWSSLRPLVFLIGGGALGWHGYTQETPNLAWLGIALVLAGAGLLLRWVRENLR